jgi:aromatic ring hydroxylase
MSSYRRCINANELLSLKNFADNKESIAILNNILVDFDNILLYHQTHRWSRSAQVKSPSRADPHQN